MKTYISKPFSAIQINKNTVEEAQRILPESFVFYGIENGNKRFEEDLSSFFEIGGFLYFNKKTYRIYNNDWVIKRHDTFEVVNQEYFEKNFIEIPGF